MRISIFHLWMLACASYSLAIYTALIENLIGSIFFTAVCLLLLIRTRWVKTDDESRN